MPRHDADLYDYLATSKVSEVTINQLEQSLENSFINKSNIEFWKGAITVHRLLEVSRTYPWGLPIPELGAIGQDLVDAAGVGTIQPPGTELWEIKGMEAVGQIGTAVIDVMWTDGAATVLMVSAANATTSGSMIDFDDSHMSAPFILSNSLYLAVTATAANAVIIKYSYQVVGK